MKHMAVKTRQQQENEGRSEETSAQAIRRCTQVEVGCLERHERDGTTKCITHETRKHSFCKNRAEQGRRFIQTTQSTANVKRPRRPSQPIRTKTWRREASEHASKKERRNDGRKTEPSRPTTKLGSKEAGKHASTHDQASKQASMRKPACANNHAGTITECEISRAPRASERGGSGYARKCNVS